MNLRDVATHLGVSYQTAARYVARWAAMQGAANIPRVERIRTGSRGRPAYSVDTGSLRAWAAAA